MIILSATTYNESSTVEGEKFKGDGYYGSNDGLHTVAYHLAGFIGIIKIQGTLSSSPTSEDWFDISDTLYSDGTTTETVNTFKNFSGNFMWIRVTITDFAAGTVNKVLYNN